MKQLAMILFLLSFLLVVVTPTLEFMHQHSDEETVAHSLSDCDCGCASHISLQAVVVNEEIADYAPAISILNNDTLIPPDPPVFSLDRPPRLFS